ncbi:MAG: tetraacyldisaccharide 4'-kinase [Phycisphaerae bacterium]|jgi:tetraacyldisaccharide 4'-kinase
MNLPGTNPRWLRLLLAPATVGYHAVIAARNLWYDRVSSASHDAGVPVISVGNLTVGGTGKTPLTIEIVSRLRAAGHRPAILTRGYGAAAEAVADEVQEFHLALPDVPVVVNPNRVAGAATARQQHNADCLVLDDGFQHRRLRRTFDVVLIDALNPWGGGRLLPAGRLREPPASLRRAHWVVITRSNQVDPVAVQELMRTIQHWAPAVPISRAALAPSQLVAADDQVRPVDVLRERVVLPVCGLGNPGTFLRLLRQLSDHVVEPLVFPDHHRYSAIDVLAITNEARRQEAACVVTTRKDWVKLGTLWASSPDAGGTAELLRLEARLELADPRGEFAARLRHLFEESK